MKIKALENFRHGHLEAVSGESYAPADFKIPDLEVEGLVKAGLVSTSKAAKKDEAPAADDLDDLVGGKMDDTEVQNKMEKAPSNKGNKK